MLPQPGEIARIGEWLIHNEGDGYGLRARRYDTSPATQIVVVEWTHPNYGYWADAGVFVKLAHAADWEPIGTPSWFDFGDKDAFVAHHPQFRVLFDEHATGELGESVELPE